VIPVLATPVLDRYDLLAGMEASVDIEVKRYYVIDNGGKYDSVQTVDTPDWWESRHVCRPGVNLGFAASVNLAIKANLGGPWWLFVNDDIIFSPGDLQALEDHMWASVTVPMLATMQGCGYSAFAINEHVVEAVGWFDEAYHPAYCEDTDFNWRCERLGIHPSEVPGTSRHLGSQTIGSSMSRRNSNDWTYPRNVKYHEAKWGGAPRSEVYATPFNKPFSEGGDPSTTTAPKLSRLRELAW
jgi:GT2 family glycosyltransferase